MCERDVLCSLTHPYLVTLRFAFQTNHRLFLVMDYIEGGHLWTHMKSGFLREDVAKVFAAEIVLALTHLHGLGIAHRDLKPENILLDSDNHCRLTDFGLAKRDMDEDSRAHTMVGTIDYMAPEARTLRVHPPQLQRLAAASCCCCMRQLLIAAASLALPVSVFAARARARALSDVGVMSECKCIVFSVGFCGFCHRLLAVARLGVC